MDTLIEKLVLSVFGGGPQAIVAILIIFIILLCMDRRRLLDEINKKDEKIEKIIDDYHKGNISLTEALVSLRLVLYEIKSQL